MSEKLTFQETKVICDRCKNEVSNLYVIQFFDIPEIDFKRLYDLSSLHQEGIAG